MENSKSILNQSNHQKQTLWQVWVPLLVGILLIVGLAILAVTTSMGSGDEGGRLAGISLIFLLIPSLVFCIFLLALLALLIFGIYKLTEVLPVYSFKAWGYVVIASDFIKVWSDRIAQPVIISQEWIASLSRFLDMFSLNPKK